MSFDIRYATLPSCLRACPRCAGELRRVERRFVDRLFSRLRPMQRYRCRDIRCGWTGNLSVALRSEPAGRWPTEPPPLARRRP